MAKILNTLKALFNRIFRRAQVEALIKEVHFENDRLDIWFKHPGIQALAFDLTEIFRETGAPNYIEASLTDFVNMENYTLTIQRRRGKTPHQIRQELEQELAALKAEMVRLKGVEVNPAWLGNPSEVD